MPVWNLVQQSLVPLRDRERIQDASTIDKLRPTLLVDEAELLEGRSEKAQAMRAIAHAGYKKGGRVARCEGDEHDVRWFEVFCPQAYAVIGGLSGALLDRSIAIHMERAPRKSGYRKSTKLKAVARVAAPLREKLEAYSLQAASSLMEAYDSAPEQGYWPDLRDREAEIWEPLLFHARMAGPEMEARLLAIIGKFSRQKASIQEDDWRVAQVLALLEAVTLHGRDTFAPADLVETVSKSEAWARAFANYRSDDEGKKAKAAAIGRVLARFRMESRKHTKIGITYRRDEAIDKLSAHLPTESLTSFTLSREKILSSEITEIKPVAEPDDRGERDVSREATGMKEHKKPNGASDGWLDFEI